MATNENTPNSKNNRIIIALAVIAIVVAVLSSLPSVQKLFQPELGKTNRQILAKVSASFDDQQFLVLKIKDGSGLQIEIYQVNPVSATQEFKQKFDLAQDSDAYVTLDKSSSNLALSDVDSDGRLDILAPSVDRNGNLRLNTFRFNSDLKMFEPFSETSP